MISDILLWLKINIFNSSNLKFSNILISFIWLLLKYNFCKFLNPILLNLIKPKLPKFFEFKYISSNLLYLISVKYSLLKSSNNNLMFKLSKSVLFILFFSLMPKCWWINSFIG